jgi:hypothetical protein
VRLWRHPARWCLTKASLRHDLLHGTVLFGAGFTGVVVCAANGRPPTGLAFAAAVLILCGVDRFISAFIKRRRQRRDAVGLRS